MRLHRHLSIAVCAMALVVGACGEGNRAGPAAVGEERLLAADKEPGNWMTHGRTYSEQRFSPLDQINAANVKDLGLAWSFDLDTHRGQESTPLVIDGVMYVTTAWSKVKALNAKTGEAIWEYDPQVPGGKAVDACCDVVNRGAAAWNGKIYVGTLDGRLIALDVATGSEVWSKQTIIDETKPYTITGAPRVIKGKVLIGNGGGEFGVRGYVTAYDAESGEQAWRFFIVPGNPAEGFENAAMEMAAKTWTGEWWKGGGGGTPWDAIVYDPVTDLVYIGTGNGSPWNRSLRSPGGGDNLFLASIVALKPETGEYVWHYQETPGDDWDYTSTQPIMTADLTIDGEKRHVVMHAPKNGFFYVIDAFTGKLISATKFATVDWATHVDLETGRPVETPQARYDETGEPFIGSPSPHGAHSWMPWSFNPATGLVYLPKQEVGFNYTPVKSFKRVTKGVNLGVDPLALEPPLDPVAVKEVTDTFGGSLLAWDPVKGEARWQVDYAGPWNGGTLSTAGNLVVAGLATGEIKIFTADKGEELWSFDAQTGVLAGPVTYTVDGEQYIAVAVGWGGAFSLVTGEMAKSNKAATRNISRVLAFKLGGTAALPEPPPLPELVLDPPPVPADEASIRRGELLYERHCNSCHGGSAASGGLVPDLRYSPRLKDDAWYGIVLEGALEGNGMVSFGDIFSQDDATDVRNYVIKRANETLAFQKPASSTPPAP